MRNWVYTIISFWKIGRCGGERVAQQLNSFLYQASIISSRWIISFINGITECILKRIYYSWAQLSSKLFRLISSLNSVEIGFRLEGFFFSLFFFIIHLLPKLNRLHLRSYGRWSSLFNFKTNIYIYNLWYYCLWYCFFWWFSHVFLNTEYKILQVKTEGRSKRGQGSENIRK